MDEEILEQEQQTSQDPQSESTEGAPLENSAPTPQNTVDAATFQRLYADSIQQNRMMAEQLEALKNQVSTLNKPQKFEEPELTDDDLARFGTVPTIKKVVQNVLRSEFADTLGDLREINQNYKRTQQLNTVESNFFAQNPNLTQYKDQLGNITRQTILNNNLDASQYATVAYAAIGQLYAQNAFQNPPVQPVNNTPSRTTPPTSNGRPPVNNMSAPKLSELERRGMRMMNLDPNKREDVESFLAAVNAEEGITMER